MKKHINIILLLLSSVNLLSGQCFLTGADLSYTNEILNNGGVYKNDDGEEVDPFEYFALRGTDIVRLRLWHTPSNNIDFCGNPISSSSLSDVLDAALKIKSNGMKLKLSIHYSDYFADPEYQKRPFAWEGISQQDLLDSIANYTEYVLNELYNQNTVPEIVSIGNETNWGFIDETNTTNGFIWEEDRDKFNIALNTVDIFNNEKNTEIKKALHFTESSALWATDQFIKNGVNNFDIIGISYYPYFSPNISLNQIGELINDLVVNYEKEVMIFETGFVWTNEYSDNYNNFMSNNGFFIGQPMNEVGQLEYLLALSEKIEENNGTGLIYWEPSWITSNLCDMWGQGSSYENVAMYNLETNQPLESFSFFDYCGDFVKTNDLIDSSIKIYPNPITKNELIIENETKNAKWTIVDILGNTKLEGKFNNKDYNKIMITNSLNGFFLLKIELENGKLLFKKIMIQKK